MPKEISPTSRLLLVVDDEALIRWSLKEILTAAGYHVLEAEDAARALSHFDGGAAAQPVDLVLLDLRLPDQDGVTLLAQIKQAKPACQAIMMTAFGTPDTTTAALRLGAYCVLNKPFDLDEVVNLVGEALAT